MQNTTPIVHSPRVTAARQELDRIEALALSGDHPNESAALERLAADVEADEEDPFERWDFLLQ